MTELTQDSLEQVLMNIKRHVEDPARLMVCTPTKLMVYPKFLRIAQRILWPHNILKRRKGVRGRKAVLNGRRKIPRAQKTTLS